MSFSIVKRRKSMSHVEAFLTFFTIEVEYSSAQCYTYPNTNQYECTELEDCTGEACSTPFHPPSAHFLPVTPLFLVFSSVQRRRKRNEGSRQERAKRLGHTQPGIWYPDPQCSQRPS
ncbi:hypothetical protein KQX54_021417 [Cotesia glomerata]|uniref:Uncharacterized protein n=1 Tax=Cotesia glomerata TaxID=32391 RepID=A0AAV7J8Z2_COTGL|nr:hypothetical protein KQX54_021417 [Cotesia glomerata]